LRGVWVGGGFCKRDFNNQDVVLSRNSLLHEGTRGGHGAQASDFLSQEEPSLRRGFPAKTPAFPEWIAFKEGLGPASPARERKLYYGR
ncbi:MAG TPA: hypothetical protein VGM17_14900, partial [Rhizomicrobium sp.]